MSKGPPPPDYDDNPIWTDEMIAAARPASEMLPPEVAALLVRRRGPQAAPTKKAVTLRLDPDVLDKFKATGPGWQSRMNEALRQAKV
ncbi:BrnA antitoxin family protein [Sphingomonas albertensis]|uniref:BrnA antitoxin family protein n=1 Tax=Sphingomonas albertensis TaxID=2762591 RepID=A0ABR7ARZ4_9SPHN|nr:BrnA antitoxin family protein [Sphingomonas albertensis]MBC3943234.1 BrnA antitoxin family protein [Sphingomonas albertensis]